ncbi:MAG: helix-turn-helix domain-containing protein [Aigarchaeota archaeon]|nr:helix-turn-helix domain-containing protein [Candidatus Pelearchaeum maunauluense]
MMKGLGEDERNGDLNYFNALRNPIRRRILQLLYENGEMSASALKRALSVSMGTLYYHLDILRPFLRQTSQKRYALNELGVQAIVGSVPVQPIVEPREPRYVRVAKALALSPLLDRAGARPALALPIAATLALTYVELLQLLGLKPISIYYLPASSGPIPDMLWSPLNLIAILLYFFIVGKLTRRSTADSWKLPLAVAVLMATLPTQFFLIYTVLAAQGVVAGGVFIQATYVVTSVWQLATFSAALNVSSGASWERALVASLFLSYIGLVILQALGYNPLLLR